MIAWFVGLCFGLPALFMVAVGFVSMRSAIQDCKVDGNEIVACNRLVVAFISLTSAGLVAVVGTVLVRIVA